ncbi:hypothetical protein RB213_012751 [Colletotrichum asianum]
MTDSTTGSPKEVGFWEKWTIPLCLIITTTLSSVLIVPHSLRWTVNEYWYESSFATITSKRTAIQFGIQLLAALLALIHTSTVAVLIQHGSRLAFFNSGGRSYGVGSSVGIQDTAITNRASAVDYSFHEDGYLPQVQCSYNRSIDFVIGREFPSRIFGVSGWLPDSVGSQQYSEYVGHSTDTIVAVGVAHSPESIRRYVSMAAGKIHLAMNATQCTRNLTRTVMRQSKLISNDVTNFYESIQGNAFLSSITAWNISSNENGTVPEAEATLRGLENAVTAISESILAAYGAAELMVGNFSDPEWLITASFRGGELSHTWNRDAEGTLVVQSTIKGPISSYTPIDQRGGEDRHHVEVISEGEDGRRVALMMQSR